MKTFAVMSLFTLAPAVVFTPARRARSRPRARRRRSSVAAGASPTRCPIRISRPIPYDTAADPSQIDWPQDTAAEEPAVDELRRRLRPAGVHRVPG